jgi:hypothetical protein
MEQHKDRAEQGEQAASDHAGELGADFAAKREAYDKARDWLFFLIEHPDKTVSVHEYSSQLKAAKVAHDAAHEAMLEAFSEPSPAVPNETLDAFAQLFADAAAGRDPGDDGPGAAPEAKTQALMPTVIHVHHDTEAHARSFNEGYEAAVTQGLSDDPTLADDWFQEKIREAKEEAWHGGYVAGLHNMEFNGIPTPNPYRVQA